MNPVPFCTVPTSDKVGTYQTLCAATYVQPFHQFTSSRPYTAISPHSHSSSPTSPTASNGLTHPQRYCPHLGRQRLLPRPSPLPRPKSSHRCPSQPAPCRPLHRRRRRQLYVPDSWAYANPALRFCASPHSSLPPGHPWLRPP